MTDPRDPDEPDFADEHSRPTYADEQLEDAGMDEDESVPDDEGGMDMYGSTPP
jgi:hypothetical protein